MQYPPHASITDSDQPTLDQTTTDRPSKFGLGAANTRNTNRNGSKQLIHGYRVDHGGHLSTDATRRRVRGSFCQCEVAIAHTVTLCHDVCWCEPFGQHIGYVLQAFCTLSSLMTCAVLFCPFTRHSRGSSLANQRARAPARQIAASVAKPAVCSHADHPHNRIMYHGCRMCTSCVVNCAAGAWGGA